MKECYCLARTVRTGGMKLRNNERAISRRTLLILIMFQLTLLCGLFFFARTPWIEVFAVATFVPATIVCFTTEERKYVVLSLVILFLSQHAIFVFSHPTWGYDYFLDSINDFQTASVISENAHFQLGQVGYSRLSYSYYPALHLFSVCFNKVSAISLMSIALYFIPILNAVLTCISLFYLNNELFGLEGLSRNIATLLFATGWYYVYFQSQFVREVYAFPIVLLSLLIVAKTVKSPSRRYFAALAVLFVSMIIAHDISSYLFFALFAMLTLGLNILRKDNRLNGILLFFTITLFTYVSFVVLVPFIEKASITFESLLSIFQRSEPGLPILAAYDPAKVYLSLGYYVLTAILAFVGGIVLFRRIRRKQMAFSPSMLLVALLAFVFVLSFLLRLAATAGSWAYDMSIRGTIWAFIGISFLTSLGMTYSLNHTKTVSGMGWKKPLIILLVICLLGVGEFSQYPLIVSSPSSQSPVTFPRYVSALWLKQDASHGSSILIAPSSDSTASDRATDMAPYAYLSGYFLDWMPYDEFKGYIPFVGNFYDRFWNDSRVQPIYSNGQVELGYNAGSG